MHLQPSAEKQLLKRTTSRCVVCKAPCPAEVWKVPGTPEQVYLERECAEHGRASVLISSDARFYWLAQPPVAGASSCGCHGGKGDTALCAGDYSVSGSLGLNAVAAPGGSFASLCTCVALIEIVNSCNLSCPTCFVSAPRGSAEEIDAVPMAEIQNRIGALLEQKGSIDVLQLSGGEPTLHPQFFELLKWLQGERRVKSVLVNTNGILLAAEPQFAARMAELFPGERLEIYLQFDGVQEEGQQSLRGADLRGMRRRAIENCAAARVPVTLAMAVTEESLPHLWKTIQFGIDQPWVRGIVFQPVFASGRTPAAGMKRINTADIILAATEQSGGRLRGQDFTPLPCGDPNCCVIGYLLRLNGRTWSICDFLDLGRMKDFLRNKLRFTLLDLARCGSEDKNLAALLKEGAVDESNTFRLVIKPFMDASTWDQDRVEHCCTHVIRPDGKLDSFCRYYAGFPDTHSAP